MDGYTSRAPEAEAHRRTPGRDIVQGSERGGERSYGTLSTEAIRARFPALERREGGFPAAYFDGPGGTQVPRTVVEAIADYLLHHNANTHWAFPTSAETDRTIAEARSAAADFLNASPGEIVFGANMTTLTFHLARSIGRGLTQGDEIVTTELDHHANVAPWRALERERGVVVRRARLDAARFRTDPDHLLESITHRTKVVAIGAASNALGTVTDLRPVVAAARRVGAMVYVDAVHYAPHRLVDVRELDCDFLVCSAYKFYGPHVGLLWGRSTLLQSLDVPKLIPAPDTAPERVETGTQNHEGIAGTAAAIGFLSSIAPGASRRESLATAFAIIREREMRLFERLWSGLEVMPGLRLFGLPPDADRTPTVAFTLAGVPSGIASRRLAEFGIFASHGDFYARTVAEMYGVDPDGFIRLGCSIYTNDEEIDRTLEAVRGLLA